MLSDPRKPRLRPRPRLGLRPRTDQPRPPTQAFPGTRFARLSSFGFRTLERVLIGASVLVILAAGGCPKPQTRSTPVERLSLILADSLRLPGPASGLYADRDGLSTADNMGTNIYRADTALQPLSPIPLPSRVPGIRALTGDPFYVYLFDDTRLHRLDRSHGILTQAASSIKGLGAVVLGSGQVAFSDGISGQIMALDPSGTMTDVSVQVAVLPGALTFGPDGNYYVLDQNGQRVVVIGRVGNLVRSVPLPGPSLRVAVDDSLGIYLLDRTGSRIWHVTRHNRVATADASDLGLNLVATEMVISRGALYVLSNGRTILKFRLPL